MDTPVLEWYGDAQRGKGGEGGTRDDGVKTGREVKEEIQTEGRVNVMV